MVVTGASTGIGRACALRLDELGFRVLAGYRSDRDAEALRAASPRLEPLPLDVTEERSIREARERVVEFLDGAPLYALVNNAGVAVASPLETVALDDLRRQLEVNVLGLVAVTQALLPELRRGPGRIVMMGSVCGILALPYLGPYTASKFALEGLSDCLRMELRPWKLRVSLVEAGSIATPIWEKSIQRTRERVDLLPHPLWALYEEDAQRAHRTMEHIGATGSSPEAVAEVVARALTARHPRSRYRVGKLSTAGYLGRFVPDWLRDRFVRLYLLR